MTIMLTGVATGVRNDAAAATVTLIRTGWGEMPSSMAAAAAMGMTMSAVAMLLMSWPSVAVMRNRPASSATGPNGPTTDTRVSATRSAAPVWVIAVDSGIIPATRTTVVHEIDLYA